MERTVDTPPWEWGTDKDAADWLHLQVAEWRRIVERWGIRPQMRLSRESRYWSWRQVVAIGLIGVDFMAPAEPCQEGKKSRNSPATPGNSPATPGNSPDTDE